MKANKKVTSSVGRQGTLPESRGKAKMEVGGRRDESRSFPENVGLATLPV